MALHAEERAKTLLAEAIRCGEECRNRVEDAGVEYGRWLLVHIFDNDATVRSLDNLTIKR